MGKLLISIKSVYSKMSKTEKKIADYILHNASHQTPLTITELSEVTGASEATIVRFAKRIGCNGYQQLKIMLAKEEHHIVNKSIDENDTFLQIYSKICDDIYTTLIKTKDSNSNETFEKAYELIMRAKEICVIGVGNSYAVATDVVHKLTRLGCNATAICDSHFQIIMASKATPETLFIAVSHSGYTRDIIDTISIAKQKDAKSIAITSDTKSPLAKLSDVCLSANSDEINYRLLGLTSRYAQLAIIDTLYTYIAMKHEESQKTIEEIEDIIINKRMLLKKKSN